MAGRETEGLLGHTKGDRAKGFDTREKSVAGVILLRI